MMTPVDSGLLSSQWTTLRRLRQQLWQSMFAHESGVNRRFSVLTLAIDPAFAPATGTQVPGGLTSREALAIVRSLRDISFVGFDVVEVNPLLEGSRTTATLAAHLIFELMSLVALQKSL